jgi:uncharacterized protein
MKACATILALGLLLVGWSPSVEAAPKSETITQDAVAECTQNLQAIGRALAAYRHDHGELPPRLSDLYPMYLADKAAFHCPADPSDGMPGPGLPADPKMPISYFYLLNGERGAAALGPAFRLGPQPLGPDATWRDTVTAARVQFGDEVPAVDCLHHTGSAGFFLALAHSGQIYRSRPDWDLQPRTIAAGLERLEQDLTAGPKTVTGHWSLGALEQYTVSWINGSLSPALRHRLRTVADRLSVTAKVLPAASRSAAHRLAARFYQGAGRTKQALAAAERAVKAPGNEEPSRRLLEELRLRVAWTPARPPTWKELKALYALYAPPPGLALQAAREKLSETDDATVSKVSYRSIDGQTVPGLLFLPKGARTPMPALVIQHGHSDSKEGILTDRLKAALVKAGLAGLAIDAALHGERRVPGKEFWGADKTPIYQTVADLRRGVDYLATVPEVDARRIGYYGVSMGGYLGAIAAGLDERFRAVVLVVAFADWRNLARVAERYGMQELRDILARANMTADVDSLYFVGHISPRPLLMQNGRMDRSVPVAAAEPLYRAARKPSEARWYPGGHNIDEEPAVIRDAMEFLTKNLR